MASTVYETEICFGDHELLAFSSEANGETEKKNTFSAVEDSTMFRWHSGTQKRVGRTKQKDQIDNETRPFWKSIVKTKHQSLSSFHSTGPGRRPSGPPYLHSVYLPSNLQL